MFSQRGLVEHFMKNVWDNTGKVRAENFTFGENCGLKLSQHLCDREGGDCLPSPALLQRQAEGANLQIGYSQNGIRGNCNELIISKVTLTVMKPKN